MAVTDVWADWSTSPASNSPLASAVPEIDGELRNVKAQLKINVMDLVSVQAITGAKTLANCTVGTGLTLTALTTAGLLRNTTAGVISGGHKGAVEYVFNQSSTANVLTATLVPAITAYFAGLVVNFRNTMGQGVTGAATLNLNAVGAKALEKWVDGAMVALATGDLPEYHQALIFYSDPYDKFVLLNPATAPVAAASATVAGKIELATDAEAAARTDAVRAVTPSQLQFGYQKYAILEHQQANNVAGGTATSGAWTQYPLNTEVIDADGIVEILTAGDANRFQLLAGTYRIKARAVFGQTAYSRIRLYDITNTAALKSSLTVYSGTGGLYALTPAEVVYEFTITGTTKLEIQYQVGTTNADDGLGSAANFGEVEVYGQVEIWKLK